MSSSTPRDDYQDGTEDDPWDAVGEEEEFDDDGTIEPDDDDEEIILQNDSVAHFDRHRDSVFAIAQHPLVPTLVATGGSEGEDDDAPGAGHVIDVGAGVPDRPVLPASYSADPTAAPRGSLESLFEIQGHTDSISAIAWTLPAGEVLVTAGMDGQLRAYRADLAAGKAPTFTLLGTAAEVPEINWLAPCPSETVPNAIALGASDGSVWVYTIDPASPGSDSDPAAALTIAQSYFLHGGPCTAGAWTPDGNLLLTVADDGSLYGWDVWGAAQAAGVVGGAAAVALTAADARFAVEGGFYSVAVEPGGTYVAVGGASGAIRVVSLPRLGSSGGGNSKSKAKSGAAATGGGQILASIQVQSDGIESLSFSAAASGTTLLAAGSVDGSIAVLDATHSFATRRTIPDAHGGETVIKVEFVPGTWTLTSCGHDSVVRRWDLRAPAASGSGGGSGMINEWKGHGEGGVMGFVQGQTGARVVTAGDDGLVLVFDA